VLSTVAAIAADIQEKKERWRNKEHSQWERSLLIKF
jgi:hypothetical protein